MAPLLTISQLNIVLEGRDLPLVNDINLTLNSGETLALVGESGAGKSLTAYAIAQLLPDNMRATGEIIFQGQTLSRLTPAQLRGLRGSAIGIVFQEPQSALNPLHRVGDQVAEVLRQHLGMTKASALKETIALFRQVELPHPEQLITRWPHQLSGGQRQRVLIAMAMACKPALLIADEPTTAIDATQQHQLMALLQKLQHQTGMAMVLISHDLALVRRYCQRVAVMADGQLIEQNTTEALFQNPQHKLSRALIEGEPSGQPVPVAPHAPQVLKTEHLIGWQKHERRSFWRTQQVLPTIRNISLMIRAGETLGVVGESGCGKTTLALTLLKLLPSEGAIHLQGQSIQNLPERDFRPIRKDIQLVFQDPYNSLNPRLTIAELLEEGLRVHTKLDKKERLQRIEAVLQDTGFANPERILTRYPHEFSGGQRQRIALARALILKPALIILDEPTSSLDRPLQQKLIDLLRTLQQKYQLAYLFISHDLAVVRTLSHRIAVMKDGQIIESGDSHSILTQPQHPYTRSLINAAFAHSAGSPS